jgi:hypothetical protein
MHIGGGPVGFFVGLVITPASTYVHTRTPAGSVSLASIESESCSRFATFPILRSCRTRKYSLSLLDITATDSPLVADFPAEHLSPLAIAIDCEGLN